MNPPIAYLNGQFLPADELLVKPQDTGFMLGVTVAEQLRTFAGQLFQLDLHFARLQDSLDILGIEDVQLSSVAEAAKEVAHQNHGALQPGNDLGVTIFVTPGIYPTYRPDGDSTPTIGIHTYPLPFALWSTKYASGQKCSVTTIQQVSTSSWPRKLKCRSRVHYYLADKEARERDPQARAILLDERGLVNEASTANVIACCANGELVSPPLESVLPGTSLRHIEQLAVAEGLTFTYRDLEAEELFRADEILLTSTPFCVLPVSQIDGHEFARRECFERLLRAWSDGVGIDIEAQAKRFA